jgi:hypothetical protein
MPEKFFVHYGFVTMVSPQPSNDGVVMTLNISKNMLVVGKAYA